MMKKLLFSTAFIAMGLTAYAQKAAPAKKTVKDYLTELHGDGVTMQVEDTKNGYLKYAETGKETEGWEEMAMWRWGKKDLIGRVVFSCVATCYPQLITFYYGGNTNPVEEIVLPTKEIEKILTDIESKFDISDEYTTLKQVDGKIQMHDVARWYKLPQKGRTLQIGFMLGQVSDVNKFVPVLDLAPKGDKFVIIKNYGISNFK